MVNRRWHPKHARRRRIRRPSSDWRESMTLSSKSPQAGQRTRRRYLRRGPPTPSGVGQRGRPAWPAARAAAPLAAARRSTSGRTSPVGWRRRAMVHSVSPAGDDHRGAARGGRGGAGGSRSRGQPRQGTVADGQRAQHQRQDQHQAGHDGHQREPRSAHDRPTVTSRDQPRGHRGGAPDGWGPRWGSGWGSMIAAMDPCSPGGLTAKGFRTFVPRTLVRRWPCNHEQPFAVKPPDEQMFARTRVRCYGLGRPPVRPVRAASQGAIK